MGSLAGLRGRAAIAPIADTGQIALGAAPGHCGAASAVPGEGDGIPSARPGAAHSVQTPTPRNTRKRSVIVATFTATF